SSVFRPRRMSILNLLFPVACYRVIGKREEQEKPQVSKMNTLPQYPASLLRSVPLLYGVICVQPRLTAIFRIIYRLLNPRQWLFYRQDSAAAKPFFPHETVHFRHRDRQRAPFSALDSRQAAIFRDAAPNLRGPPRSARGPP